MSKPPLPLPPLTYYAMNVVAVIAIAAGVYLVYAGLPVEPTRAELAAFSDARLARAEALAADVLGERPLSLAASARLTPPGQSASTLTITLGVQAILSGILLAGFGTIINLLHRIAHR